MAKRATTDWITPWVLEELRLLIPEGRRQQERFYLTEARRALAWFGPLSARPQMPDGLNHIEVLLLFAGHGMQMLSASNYRAWTAAKNLLHFQRALFLRTLVIGAGSYLSHSALMHPSGGAAWGPFHQSGHDFFGKGMPRQKPSNTPIPAHQIEQAVFHHLFPTALSANSDPMAGMATIGAFEPEGDRANPIVLSLRRGIRKSLVRYRIIPGPLIEPWLNTWSPTLLAQIEDLEVHADPGGEIVKVIEAPDGPESGQESGWDAPAVGPPNASAPERGFAGEVDLARRVRRLIEAGEILTSRPNAPLHGFRGVPLLVWPDGLRRMAEALGMEDESVLRDTFIQQRWLMLNDGEPAPEWIVFAPMRGKRRVPVGRAQAVPLSESGVEALLPESQIPDNQAIALPEEVDGA